MQQVIFFVLWVLFSLLVQTVILPDFPSIRIWTDFLFYLVIIMGLRFSLVAGVALAAVLGFIMDSVSVVPYGTSIISYVLTLIFIRMVMANIYLENKLSLFVWVGVFSIFKQLIQDLYFTMQPSGYQIDLIVIGNILIQALWDAFLGMFILPLLEKLFFTDLSEAFRKKGLRS